MTSTKRTKYSSKEKFLQVCLLLGLLLVSGQSQALAAPATQTTVGTYLPMVANKKCFSPIAANRFGVQMYGDTSSTNRYHPFILESGARWVRAQAEWRFVEPNNVAPDQYDWSSVDTSVGIARENCVNMLLTHTYAPSWAATVSNGPIDKVALTELTDYLGALVERYDGDGFNDAPGSPIVTYFELYNEPDLGELPNNSGGWGLHGDKYAEMLKAAYPVMKAANPNAQVVFGGIAFALFTDDPTPGHFVRSFTDDVLKAGAGPFFDYMCFHKYALIANCATCKGPGIVGKAAELRAILNKYSVSKPFLISETGWHSNSQPGLPGGPEVQARLAVEVYTELIVANVDMGIWFHMHDLDGYPFDNGLVTDGTPITKKPAFTTYQLATRMLKDLTFVRTLPQSETQNANLAVHQFTSAADNSTYYIAWLNPTDSTATVALSLPAAKVKITDMNGGVREVKDGDDGRVDQKVRLNITADPVYIQVVPA